MSRRRRRGRGWLAPVLVVLLVVVWALFGERLRGLVGLPGDGAAPAKPADRLRIATWNLRNFPDPAQDPGRLRERLHGLDADLLAVQELLAGTPRPSRPAATSRYPTPRYGAPSWVSRPSWTA